MNSPVLFLFPWGWPQIWLWWQCRRGTVLEKESKSILLEKSRKGSQGNNSSLVIERKTLKGETPKRGKCPRIDSVQIYSWCQLCMGKTESSFQLRLKARNWNLNCCRSLYVILKFESKQFNCPIKQKHTYFEAQHWEFMVDIT